jgi:hypothetical protein
LNSGYESASRAVCSAGVKARAVRRDLSRDEQEKPASGLAVSACVAI